MTFAHDTSTGCHLSTGKKNIRGKVTRKKFRRRHRRRGRSRKNTFTPTV